MTRFTDRTEQASNLARIDQRLAECRAELKRLNRQGKWITCLMLCGALLGFSCLLSLSLSTPGINIFTGLSFLGAVGVMAGVSNVIDSFRGE